MIDDLLESVLKRRKHRRHRGLRYVIGRAIAGELGRYGGEHRRASWNHDSEELHRVRARKRRRKKVRRFDDG